MFKLLKRKLFFVCLVFLSQTLFAASLFEQTVPQIEIDSLIKEKSIDNSMTQLELLVLYQKALEEDRKDSVQIFKDLAILNADLEQPEDAYKYTLKYINNTLDFDLIKNPAYENIKGTKEYEQLNDAYSTKINFIAFLFFYAALIGFSFTLIINFLKGAKSSSKFFISGFVGVHSFFVLEFVFFISNLRFKFPHVYLIASTVALLYGPFLYFYFKSLTHNFKFKAIDLLHFLPNVVLLIYLAPMYLLDSSEKIRMMLRLDYSYFNNRYIIFFTKIISLSVYAILIGRLYYKNKNQGNNSQDGMKSVNDWKQNIYRIHVAYIIIYLLYGISAMNRSNVMSISILTYLMVGSMAIMIFYIAYMSYVQPGLFSENLKSGGDIFISKYKKSGLTNALSNELKDSLINLLVEDELYKNSSLNLDLLSEKLGTTRHNTSQIINEHFDMNFFELINKFRIKEATKLLESDVHGNLNIIDIAFEVGYNNKVTFNKAFKKETSITPSEFIHLHDKSNFEVKI